MTVVALISYFRGMLIVIFRRINFNEGQQVISCSLFSLFSTEIDIVINTPKTEFSNIFRIQSLLTTLTFKSEVFFPMIKKSTNRKRFA